MTAQKALEILEIHNNWRRGKEEDTPYTIKELGEAINLVVANQKALIDFVDSVAIYKLNQDGQRELTAIKLSDFEKLKELYNKIIF